MTTNQIFPLEKDWDAIERKKLYYSYLLIKLFFII